MANAFDRVEWSYPRGVLLRLGFPKIWAEMVMGLVSTPTFSILLADGPFPPFPASRGLRQDDPLSPYLLHLVSKGLSGLLADAVHRQQLHGVSICCRAPSISHMMFADDTIVFCRATPFEAREVMRILHVYETLSGQYVNLSKSKAVCSRRLTTGKASYLQHILGMRWVASHQFYLGTPTRIGRSRREVFSFIKEYLWSRLQGWKERLFSSAGQEVLIKSVYIIQTFLLPKGLCEELRFMVVNF